MFNFFNWGKNAEDEEFDNRILKRCPKHFRPGHQRPYLKDFDRLEKLGKGTEAPCNPRRLRRRLPRRAHADQGGLRDEGDEQGQDL